MKVIKFPRSEQRKRAIGEDHHYDHKMYMGGFRFTCPCGNIATVTPTNAIFRRMDFYCSSCGSPHRITNPAFTAPKK